MPRTVALVCLCLVASACGESYSTDADALDPSLVRTTLEGIADLDPDGDGRCQSVSAAFGAEPVR